MNRIYRLVWNCTMNVWVAVAENAKGKGKSTVSGRKLIALAAAAIVPMAVSAAPLGGTVTSGAGTIAQVGAVTNITQTTPKLAINWQEFGIATGETVNFLQPSALSIALNRVVGQTPSQILGNLNANGQVFVLNPNGVLFGAGAQVNVGGLVASTLNLSDADFNADKFTFSNGGVAGTGTVDNQGALNAANGGYIALISPTVTNTGSISAQQGMVALAAGNTVTLNLNNGSLLGYTIDAGTANALISNGGLISANGGQVLITAQGADALSTAVVNNTGVIEAQTVRNVGGVIKLMADMTVGQVNVSGTLDASAPAGGDGGFVETSAATVNVADAAKVTTASALGVAGNWLIDPIDFTIAATGGNITGATLSTNLGTGNVSILSSSGTAGTAGAVNVNDVVAWSANKLTLNAQNNININANLNGSGTASLALQYGQGTVAAGNLSDYIVHAAVNLPAGQNFSTKLGLDGLVKNYTVITTLGAAGGTTATDLQGMNGNLAGNYALGGNIDATATVGWNASTGFAPIGSQSSPFTGTFDGLGHTINDLAINQPTINGVGMFGWSAGAGFSISNVGLVGGSVNGGLFVGGLVGYKNGGTVNNSYTSGNVSGSSSVGGLVGHNYRGAVSDSYAMGNVSSNAAYGYISYAGGLVGYNNDTGTVSSSYATGNVSGSASVGGLVGRNRDFSNSYAISDSYATGKVSGYMYVGGLVGQIDGGNIRNSYATGDVSGNQNIGGLIGQLLRDHTGPSNISNSYATGSVTGIADIYNKANGLGGLVGSVILRNNGGGISNSYATGSVSGGGSSIGGLVGSMYSFSLSAISNSYATGSVSGGSIAIGGLVGTLSASLPSNVTIQNSHATGNVSGSGDRVGGLVGDNYGVVSNSYATGNVTGTGQYIGGLIGRIDSGALLSNSYATGTVSGDTLVGGLVGRSWSTVSNSYSTGAVTGTGGSNHIGGLMGCNNGSIINSYATGTATGAYYIGGLVGRDWGSISGSHSTGNVTGTIDVAGGLVGGTYLDNISNSYSTGNVIGVNNVGGLVGITLGGLSIGVGSVITNSYATGSVTGSGNYIGGLVGLSNETGSNSISNSYSTGAVSGVSLVGGLVGWITSNHTISNAYASGNVKGSGTRIGGLVGQNDSMSSISNAYATGNVTGSVTSLYVGGLVGYNIGTITNTYATGSVTGNPNPGGYFGGLVGIQSGTVSNSFWDTVTSNQSTYGGGAGTTGLTTAQMQQQSNFNSWDFTNTWRIYDGHTAPLLKSFLKPLTVTASGISGNLTKTYNGQEWTGSVGTLSFSDPAAAASGQVLGITTPFGNAVNVGNHEMLWSGQRGYDISYTSGGQLTINPAPLFVDLAVAANPQGKVYGASDPLFTFNASGFVSSDTAASVLTGALSRIAGENVGAYAITQGTLAANSNYIINYTGADLTITQAALNIVANALSKVYGSVDPTLSYAASGFQFTDSAASVLTGGLARAAGKNVGSYAITQASLASNSNYTVQYTGANLDITPYAMTISALGQNKVYDSTTNATVALSHNGFAGDDLSSGFATANFADKNAGIGKVVTANGITLGGADAGNYTFNTTAATTADITKFALAIAATGENKVYDSTTNATVALSHNGFAGDDLSSGFATANFADKNAGIGKVVTANGITLGGADAGNYTFNTTAATTADITKAYLSLAAITENKVYDATTGAVVTLINDGYSGDDLSTSFGTANFADKNVGINKLVTVGGITLSGADAGNYSFSPVVEATADIAARAMLISATGVNKVFDGTTAATVVYSDTRIAGDQFTVSGTAVFESAHVELKEEINVTNIALTGVDALNYTYNTTAETFANITAPMKNIAKLPDTWKRRIGNDMDHGKNLGK